MTHFITIAGPQSSGKTTALNYLKDKHPDWVFIEDINPYTISGENHKGAAYVDRELEAKILEVQLLKLQPIRNIYGRNSVAETGIFHLVYGSFFGRKKLTRLYEPNFFKLYQELNSLIVFIDTTPEVSFERRKEAYKKRVEALGINNFKNANFMLKKYKNTIYKLYPYWHKFYEKLQFPKIIIENSNISKGQFLEKIEATIKKLL